MFWKARNPDESWRGEKERTKIITDGKHRNLNIGTESIVQIDDALGKELHHSNMSKLWDSNPLLLSLLGYYDHEYDCHGIGRGGGGGTDGDRRRSGGQ